MKIKFFQLMIAMVIILSFPNKNFAQAPNLGTAANFVLFSTIGAVTNTGSSHLTGNVGTNSGSSTGFGNVDGVMHDGDGASAQCAADLLTAYNQLNSTTPTFFPSPLMGNGATLVPGVYSISSAATLNLNLILNGQGNPNAVFIFKIQGSFSTNAYSKIKLINGALACNVFWKVEGLVSMATGTAMKGTVIANNAAINMSVGDTLEGRALSTTGAVTCNGILAYTPIGCGSPYLTGPLAPTLNSTECYALFSSNGAVSNSGITHVTGDVGTNTGLTTGFQSANVNGTIHPIPDASTAQCGADLTTVYNYLNTLPYDIELLYPAQFGNNLVLTPHTYLLNAATVFTDTLFLNAEGNANAVFVLKLNGALSTSTYATVTLVNGAQAKNVYWKIEGAVSINNYSFFCGTIVCHNGAISSLNTGVILNGRAFTTNGALTTNAMTATMPAGCGIISAPNIITQPVSHTVCAGSSVSFSVSATGTGLSYHWRKGTVNLINGGNISGATSATLIINPVNASNAANNYNVVVSGSGGPSETSSNVSLTLNTAPSITTPPSNQTACAGSSVSFSVTATGTGLTYHWRKGTVNLVNGGNISGSASATLMINPANAADAASNYNVVITGTCSPVLTSSNVSLTLNTLPAITSAPVDQTVCAGGSVSFSVTATGSGITYQWRKGTIYLVNGGNISGANSPTLTINPVSTTDAASNYKVTISGTCTPGATSQNASLTVNTPPQITTMPVSQVACLGGSASFSVVASGSVLTYQWRKGMVNLINGVNISGATSATLTIDPMLLTDTSSGYNVIISGSCAPTVASANVTLSLCTGTDITSFDPATNGITVYPNPFTTSVSFFIKDAVQVDQTILIIYNVLGEEILNTNIISQITMIETTGFSSGIYFYKIMNSQEIIQSGKLISQQ